MSKAAKELQKIRGIGEVLAQRLAETGLDTFDKIAVAGEDELRRIKGVNPRTLQSIIGQAAELAKDAGSGRAQRVAVLKAAAGTVREQVEAVARSVRDRFNDELQGKAGKKAEKELQRMTTALERVEGSLETRLKRAGKGLAKAEKRLAGLSEAGLKGVGKGLRRARKSLKRVFA